ncbi:MAG: endo-1,4-beta-xylanase [Sedimentisphaerales bacterium]|nr:endo-1,4-beta-xylanase [Sedimentisphaerales bacterium]
MNAKLGLLMVIITLSAPLCLAKDPNIAAPAAIDARIAEIRMGDIIVKAKPGSDISVRQIRHEFLFGTAIGNHLAENSPNAMSAEDRKMFLKILSENFNYAVHENALKWYDCEAEPNVVDYSRADRIWEICNELNIPMRGHCIFWEKDKYIMSWLNKLNNDQLRAAVCRRALDVTKHFKGRITEFDLNNEMVHGDFFRRRLGYGIVNEMAYMAKAGNPDIALYVNDYGILVEGGYNAATYITQIETLLKNGVPIDGIGCQGHFVATKALGKAPTTPEHVQKTLDQLAKFNLPIKLTECLFMGDSEQDKADALRMFFPVCFAHPNVEAIIMWCFWEQDHWMPHTAMWRKDWTPTPQADAYRDLVFNKWWTQTAGKANRKGIFKTRAFFGDYVITSGGVEKKVTLGKKNKSVEVAFD